MLAAFIFCGILFSSFVLSENMIGHGKWNMLNIQMVPGNFDELEFNITQRKYNRTHNCFQGKLHFHEELNENFGAKVDVCKFVDGGCKQYQVLSDDSFSSMILNYAGENFKEILSLCGVDPPELPVLPGEYELPQYLFDFAELPDECPYGHYIAKCCAMRGTAEVGCVSVEIEFVKHEDDDEDEEE